MCSIMQQNQNKKNATGTDTSNLAAKFDLVTLIAKTDKINIDN